jgi:hypothetical protein
MDLKLKNVRLAFAAVFTPKTNEDGKKNYKGAYPIDPGSSDHDAIVAAMKAVAKEKWGEKAPDIFKKLKADRKLCYEERSPSNDSGEVYEGFEDMFVLNSNRTEKKGRVTLLDRDRTPLSESDGKPYSGCYVNAVLDIWAQDNAHGKRINCELRGLQFVKDGDAFGGGAAASVDDFDELEEIDDGADDDFA